MDRLAEQLRRFDGRSVEPFRDALEWLPDEPAVLDELVERGAEPELAVGAAWLLKERLAGGSEPPPGFARRFAELLIEVEHPLARLNLLQCLQHLELDRAVAGRLFEPLCRWTDAESAFVRAWAYDGLGRLARVDGRRRERIEAILDRAAIEEKASIRARIRKLRAER